jgi:predicted nucleic acid-binding protein
MRALDRGNLVGTSSVLTLAEVLVHPLKLGRIDLAARYREVLGRSTAIRLVPVDRHVAERAAELRARLGVKTPDAIQLASAIHSGARAFVTNDRKLPVVRELDIVIIDDFAVGSAAADSGQ